MLSRLLFVAIVCTGCMRNAASPFDVIDAAPVPDATPIAPTLSSIRSHVIVPICEDCHVAPLPDGAMDLSAADLHGTLLAPVAGPKCKPEEQDAGVTSLPMRVVPGDPAASVLYSKVAAKAGAIAMPICGDPMPRGTSHPALSQAQLDAIKTWIMNGAQDD